MASINFVKGTITGKVGQFVGSSWRGIHYIKTYTKPSNPRTPDQVAVRSVFQHIARIAKALHTDVLKPYTFPKPQKMTAYNHMLKINQPMFAEKIFDPSKLKIFDGPLINRGIDVACLEEAGTSNEQVLFRWNYDYDVDGADDITIPIIYDEISRSTFFTLSKRSQVEAEVKIGLISPVVLTKLHAYVVFVKPPAEGTSETGLVSKTAYSKLIQYPRSAADQPSTHPEADDTDE